MPMFHRFLKFHFMDIEEINAPKKKIKTAGKDAARAVCAGRAVTRPVHGEEGLVAAKRITECLFSGSLSALSEADFEQLAQTRTDG